jgi:hypothetical protein
MVGYCVDWTNLAEDAGWNLMYDVKNRLVP